MLCLRLIQTLFSIGECCVCAFGGGLRERGRAPVSSLEACALCPSRPPHNSVCGFSAEHSRADRSGSRKHRSRAPARSCRPLRAPPITCSPPGIQVCAPLRTHRSCAPTMARLLNFGFNNIDLWRSEEMQLVQVWRREQESQTTAACCLSKPSLAAAARSPPCYPPTQQHTSS